MPLSDDQLRAIGRMTVSFGRLEHSASSLLWLLVNENQNIGRVAFENERFWRVLDTIGRLCPYALGGNPELQRRIKEWIGKARAVAAQRNEVLHALWAENQPSGEMVALLLTRKNMPKAQTRAADLDQLAIEVTRAAREVDGILVELLPRAN